MMNYSSKCTVLVAGALKKKGKSQLSKKTEETHKLLVSILVFVSDSYEFCDSCIC